MSGTGAGPPGAHEGLCVLIAEDNEVNRLVATSHLKQLGYDVDVACDGIEALEHSDRAEYAAILMDCQMPRLDGYSATREIRRREGGGNHVPVIAMTAHMLQGDRKR